MLLFNTAFSQALMVDFRCYPKLSLHFKAEFVALHSVMWHQDKPLHTRYGVIDGVLFPPRSE